MTAHLTENMELTPFFKLPSSQLIGSLGSVAPIVLMILLLLLCFPFKKKKHHLSIRTRKKDLNMSELIDLTKLEDGLPPERKSLADQCLPKGNTLPSHQAKQQSNGFSSELQQGNADSPKYTQQTLFPLLTSILTFLGLFSLTGQLGSVLLATAGPRWWSPKR